jgi:hypothetical protein
MRLDLAGPARRVRQPLVGQRPRSGILKRRMMRASWKLGRSGLAVVLFSTRHIDDLFLLGAEQRQDAVRGAFRGLGEISGRKLGAGFLLVRAPWR